MRFLEIIESKETIEIVYNRFTSLYKTNFEYLKSIKGR